jgi:hypothetical protein
VAVDVESGDAIALVGEEPKSIALGKFVRELLARWQSDLVPALDGWFFAVCERKGRNAMFCIDRLIFCENSH